jgi:hypothetical protein
MNMLTWRLLLSAFFVMVAVIVATGFAVAQSQTPYFEFAPKISDPLDIDDQSGDVFEVFFPQNDHLSGIDIWVDNTGVGGQVSFGLRRDGNDSLLTAATVNILENVSPSFEGSRIHIDFPAQVFVNSDEKYTVKILSEIPDFRVYKSNRRLILLGHNAPYTSEYINGVARINDSEQDFSFKFALYENNESLPPVITNVKTEIISLDAVQLSFNANEPVDFKVQYGPMNGSNPSEISFSGEYSLCSQGATPCLASFSVLPDTTYNYTLTARDDWGNETLVSGSFESLESPTGSLPPVENEETLPPLATSDTTSPTISNLRTIWIKTDSVKIAWTTNEVANASLRVTEDEAGNLGAVTFVSDPIFELEHVLTSPAFLSSATTYYAHIRSVDLSGNISESSIQFITLSDGSGSEGSGGDEEESGESNETSSTEILTGEEEEVPAPSGGILPPPTIEFSAQETTTEEGIVSGKGAISFQWQIPSEGPPEDGYRIDVFDESGQLVKQVFVKDGSENQAKIRGLGPGKYTIIIYSNRGGVFEKIAEPTQIVVLPKTLLERIFQFWYIYILIISALVLGPWYLVKRERVRLSKVEIWKKKVPRTHRVDSRGADEVARVRLEEPERAGSLAEVDASPASGPVQVADVRRDRCRRGRSRAIKVLIFAPRCRDRGAPVDVRHLRGVRDVLDDGRRAVVGDRRRVGGVVDAHVRDCRLRLLLHRRVAGLAQADQREAQS